MTYAWMINNLEDCTYNDMNLMKSIGFAVAASVEKPDVFYFMENFNFPDLKVVKKSLTKSKQYSQKQISEILSGLKTLPEYNRA